MPEQFREHFIGDPFAITPDPRVYIPRAATEGARKKLLRSACNPAKTTALIGPPGLGKTLLLHLLAEQVPEDMQTVYLPYAALPPAELCAWALGLLGRPVADDPIEDFQALGRDLRDRGSSLLMLIDDAGAMPIATARWAGELVKNSGGSVRLAVAASDNATGNRTIAAIGSNFDIVHLADPMTTSETRKYIDGRLALARVPDSIRARFDDQIVDRLHRTSAGIPRRLHSAAVEILQEAPVTTTDGLVAAPKAPVAAPVEPVELATPPRTLGVQSGERRVSRRRAEPEGIPVRVGRDGGPDDKGRRAEDRGDAPRQVVEAPAAEVVEAPAEEFGGLVAEEPIEPAAEEPIEPAAEERVESAAEEPVESESIESAEATGRPTRDRESAAAPSFPRRAPAPSRRTIALGSILVAFSAVAIPVIRSLLSEPRHLAVVALQVDPLESVRADLRDPVPADLPKSGEAIEPGISAAGEANGETRAAARAGEPHIIESSTVEPPLADALKPLAVQINAYPWAIVEVDGIDLGATPLANIPLFAGAHSFRVRMPDGRVIERTIEIDTEKRFLSFE